MTFLYNDYQILVSQQVSQFKGLQGNFSFLICFTMSSLTLRKLISRISRVKRGIFLLLVVGFLIYHLSLYSDTLQTFVYETILKKDYYLGTQVHLENVSRLPHIQFDFSRETYEEKLIREQRQNSVREGFLHGWRGYAEFAWGFDEVKPISNGFVNTFNGWGATIVDSLDTMLIMGLKEEFALAREFVSTLDFLKSNSTINVFETNIRYLGGLLSAYELSKDQIFLDKAHELGRILLPAFNSTSGLPYNFLAFEYDACTI